MGNTDNGNTPWRRFADPLAPGPQEALGHPTRREIVRALNESKRALSIAELVAELATSAAEVHYHVQVLRRCEAIGGDDSRPVAAGRHNAYRSLIGGDMEARSVLRATEQWDREQRRAAAQRSTRFMTMFRIPRPTRTLRLGLDRSPSGRPDSV